jgi:hypothetical protein
METYLPLIKALLSQWYLLTLSNPLYAGVVATAAWLLTATLYSIRIASLKRAKIASEKLGLENLNASQQQLQQSQDKLAAAEQQMEKFLRDAQDETQRALVLEQLIYQRNQQIAGIIQTLAMSVDLGERPLLASEDVKADLLWQQHEKVITQLIERLRSELQSKTQLEQACAAETAKLAEKEALFDALQSTLNSHANQLSKLEQAFEEQKSKLQQQDNTQQVLSDALRNHQPSVAQPPEPQKEPIKTAFIEYPTREYPTTENTLTEQPTRHPEIGQINEKNQTAITGQNKDELVRNYDAAAYKASDIKPKLPDEEASTVSLDKDQQPANPGNGSLRKIKNLFGQSKQQPIKTEPQWTIPKADEQEDSLMPSGTKQLAEDEASVKTKKTQGKLKGFYSKFTSKAK